jgi:DNA polymerase-1
MPPKKADDDVVDAPAPAPTRTVKPFVLVDGSSYLYRAFHALPNLTNSKGRPTGAIYGVTNMLKRLLKDYDPVHIAVVFDAKGKTFRDDIYKEYKANRPSMPEELAGQIQPIHDIVRALGLPLLQVPGVEADDVIGTLARRAAREGTETLVVTGDKDIAQLVGPSVRMVDTMKEVEYDEAKVAEKFGVAPNQIVDYLALVGDTSDNIPGVPGVGPKTAAKWLQQYGSLDAVVQHRDDISGKVGESLRASLTQLPLAKELATIKCDVNLGLVPADLKREAPQNDALRRLYAECEFKTWLSELGGAQSAAHATPVAAAGLSGFTGQARYETVDTLEALDRWIERLTAAKLFAFDTETTDLDTLKAEIVGVSFACEAGHAAYVPLAHNYPGAPEQLNRDAALKKLAPLLEDDRLFKIGQNFKYDLSVLQNYGVTLRGTRFDTMLESYVLDSTASRHDMDSLALKYLGYKTVKYEEVAGKGKHQINFSQVGVAEATTYAAEDADVTLRLHQHLWPLLSQHVRLKEVFEEIEMPLAPVLARMERNGVKIDVNMLKTQSHELGHRVLEIERQAHAQAGQPFNLASPKQIQEILYGKQNIPVLKKTPTGQPSTAEDVLEELAANHELPRLILEHRSLSKLKSTYTDKLPEMINSRTGRVHTSYHQAVAATGRLSSADPNLQNIPVRTQEGRRIREAFVAENGHRLISADYSQIELRIMAHLSQDEGLIAAFAKNLDIHRATAAEVFGATPEMVTDEMRRAAKAINFGLIYGMSAFGLAQQLRIERAAAQTYVDKYFARYPGVRAYMERTRAQAREQGFVETLFGRRLYLPEINASNQGRRQGAERAAINAPMQGTAADLIKLAMIKLDAWIESSNPNVRMIMQVHDELVFEVKTDEVEPVLTVVRQTMSEAAALSVPLVVDVGVGGNWDEAH